MLFAADSLVQGSWLILYYRLPVSSNSVVPAALEKLLPLSRRAYWIHTERTALIMNQTRIEQQSTSLTPPTEDLTTPHFDDSAVATAHQVEPLPQRAANRFESSRYAITIASAIVLGIVLGIAAVVIPSRSTANPETPASMAEASAQMDSLDAPVATAVAEMTKPSLKHEKSQPRIPQVRARRAMGRYMAEEFGDDDDYSSRRSARRVGVIYYGRSRGEDY
jgi:hypothetical protein